MRLKLGILDLALLIGLVFAVGYTSNAYIANAQNQTASQSFAATTDLTFGTILIAALSIINLIKSLVDRGILSKRIGTVAVMAGDAAVAIGDTRQTVKDVVQNTYETVQLISPEAAKFATDKIQPVVRQAGQKVAEYQPKIDKFGDIAKNLGKKPGDDIKSMQDIPTKVMNRKSVG